MAPWPVFTLVFGGVDRIFGVWALLRYPNSRLSLLHRRYLITLAGWMLAGRDADRRDVDGAVERRVRRPRGGPPCSPTSGCPSVLNYVVHGGEASAVSR